MARLGQKTQWKIVAAAGATCAATWCGIHDNTVHDAEIPASGYRPRCGKIVDGFKNTKEHQADAHACREQHRKPSEAVAGIASSCSSSTCPMADQRSAKSQTVG
jgi:hypothetical protein